MICEICRLNMDSCDKHHIHSRTHGGSNDTFNKVSICPNCHRKVHTGEIILEGKFSTTGGIQLVWRNKGEVSKTGVKDPLVFIYGGKENGKE